MIVLSEIAGYTKEQNRWMVEWMEGGAIRDRIFATSEECVQFARQIVEDRRQNREEARDA